MKQQQQKPRRNSMTRTYPIYIDSADDFVEIVPIERRRRRRRRRTFREEKHFEKQKQRTAQSQTDDETKKDESSTSNYLCLRIFSFILTIFILIVSILLLIFSLNLIANPNMTKLRSIAIVYASATPSSGFTGSGPTDTLLVTSIIGIVLGTFILIVSIVSLILLICIRTRFHCCFFCLGPICLLIIFLVLIGLTIFIVISGDTELQRLASSTQTTLYYFYNTTTTVQNGWDFVQYYFNCCGVKSNKTDWLPSPTTGWIYSSSLPRSCCGYDSSDIGHAGRIFVASDVPSLIGFCYYGDIRKSTCYDTIKTNLFITVLVFLIGLGVIILILAILLLVLFLLFRTIHNAK